MDELTKEADYWTSRLESSLDTLDAIHSHLFDVDMTLTSEELFILRAELTAMKVSTANIRNEIQKSQSKSFFKKLLKK